MSDDFSSLAESAEGDIVDDNLEVEIDGVVKDVEIVDDKDKRRAVEFVEKFLTEFGNGSHVDDSVVATIQKLFTFDEKTIKMISDVVSSYVVTVVDAHSSYLDDLVKIMRERVNGMTLLSGEVYVAPVEPLLAGRFEAVAVLRNLLQYRVSVDAKRAESAFKALHSAKVVEENLNENKRSNTDRLLGKNRKPSGGAP